MTDILIYILDDLTIIYVAVGMIRVRNMRCYIPGIFPLIFIGIATLSALFVFMFSTYFTFNAKHIIAPQGLKINGSSFTMGKKPFQIMSGSLHYFRVPENEWEDRLLKMKAMALNSVDM